MPVSNTRPPVSPPRAGQAGGAAPAKKAEAKQPVAKPDVPELSLEDIKKLSGGDVRAPKVPRFRFAPSPTGYLHIGGAYIAMMNAMAAKKMGGEFVLRIEDTDQLRSKPEYTGAIMDGLKWLGIEWKGDVLYQSQRTDIYKAKVQNLLDEGKAYKDASGAVFFKMPDEGSLVINDRVKGRVTINLADADGMKDFVIQGSDGAPKFLLANVIDDGEQGVTHVIRGEDHLTNAAKQICLFRAMGYPVPEFYHVPLIMGDDNHKLSKRHGATSLLDFQKQGFLPDVVTNHLARLAQNFGTDATLSFDELAKGFDHLGFATKPTKIGFEKLHMRNREAMSKMDTAELKKALEAQDPELMKDLGKIGGHALAEAAKDRATTLDEATRLGRLLRDEPVYGPDDAKVYGAAGEKKLMGKLLVELQKLPANDWNLISLRGTMEHFNNEEGTSFAQWNTTLRWMLTGLPDGVPLEHTLAIVGRDDALSRLADAVK